VSRKAIRVSDRCGRTSFASISLQLDRTSVHGQSPERVIRGLTLAASRYVPQCAAGRIRSFSFLHCEKSRSRRREGNDLVAVLQPEMPCLRAGPTCRGWVPSPLFGVELDDHNLGRVRVVTQSISGSRVSPNAHFSRDYLRRTEAWFKPTASRIKALNARSSNLSPSQMSMARRTFPSRLALNSLDGSFSEAPRAKVIFT
jgi:hypothetical protein